MPVGYPDSVTPDYLAYQLWAVPSHITGWMGSSLITSSLLAAVGLKAGAGTAAAGAASIRWITKDGIGALGRLLVGFLLLCLSHLSSKPVESSSESRLYWDISWASRDLVAHLLQPKHACRGNLNALSCAPIGAVISALSENVTHEEEEEERQASASACSHCA